MAKLTLNDISNISGAESTAIATINNNSTAIETALENTLSRNGASPNTMSADIDLNGNDLLNVGTVDADNLTLAGVDYTDSLQGSVAEAEAAATAAALSETNAAQSATEAAASAAEAATFDPDLFPTKANNLSDLASTSTALTNLGGMAIATYDPSGQATDIFNSDNISFLPNIVGAVSTSVQRKVRERVSVFDNMSDDLKDRITAGTVTDVDAPVITDAINAVLSGVGTDSQVEFPSGLYLIDSPLNLPSDCTVIGSGWPTIKPIAGSTANPLLFQAVTKSGIEVRGIKFDGNRTNVTGFTNVNTIFQSTDVKFIDCRWTNTRGIAIIFSACIESGVLNSRFFDCGTLNRTTSTSSDRKQAIAFTGGGTDNFANFNRFETIGLDCISMAGGEQNPQCVGNYVRDTDAGSIYISTALGAVVAFNNVSNGSTGGNGIDVPNSTDFIIALNICIGNGAAGILIAGDCKRWTIVGNICKNNNQSGISVHQGGISFHLLSGQEISDGSVSGNTCVDTQGVSVTQRNGIGIADDGGTWARIKIGDDNNLVGYDASGNVSGLNIFQLNAFGAQPFPRMFSLTAGSSFVISPDSVRGRVSVENVNSNAPAEFAIRGVSSTLEMLDPAAAFEAVDGGSLSAIFRDSADSKIKLKNNTGLTRTYVIRMNYSIAT